MRCACTNAEIRQYFFDFSNKNLHFLNKLQPPHRQTEYLCDMHLFFAIVAELKFLCEKINNTIADEKFLLYLQSILRHECAT